MYLAVETRHLKKVKIEIKFNVMDKWDKLIETLNSFFVNEI